MYLPHVQGTFEQPLLPIHKFLRHLCHVIPINFDVLLWTRTCSRLHMFDLLAFLYHKECVLTQVYVLIDIMYFLPDKLYKPFFKTALTASYVEHLIIC